MSTFEELKAKLLRKPHALIGYLSASPGTRHEPGPLRQLFNDAGQPVPKELQETKADTYEISRQELAKLVYLSARKNGSGPLSSVSYWLKARLG